MAEYADAPDIATRVSLYLHEGMFIQAHKLGML